MAAPTIHHRALPSYKYTWSWTKISLRNGNRKKRTAKNVKIPKQSAIGSAGTAASDEEIVYTTVKHMPEINDSVQQSAFKYPSRAARAIRTE